MCYLGSLCASVWPFLGRGRCLSLGSLLTLLLHMRCGTLLSPPRPGSSQAPQKFVWVLLAGSRSLLAAIRGTERRDNRARCLFQPGPKPQGWDGLVGQHLVCVGPGKPRTLAKIIFQARQAAAPLRRRNQLLTWRLEGAPLFCARDLLKPWQLDADRKRLFPDVRAALLFKHNSAQREFWQR